MFLGCSVSFPCSNASFPATGLNFRLALNGIRHGGAKTIRIAGGIDGNTLEFSVRDDGCGFDPENFPGVDDGRHLRLAVKDERSNGIFLKNLEEAMQCAENH